MKKYLLILVVLLTAINYSQTEDKRNSMNSYFSVGAISVTIGGSFIVTGTFPALITERVDQFVTRMFNEAKSEALSRTAEKSLTEQQEIERRFDEISFRNVTLKRTTGETLKLDLVKFRESGDFSQNPYLKNDDVIIFAPTDIQRSFFSVYGAVNKEGTFNFVDGDKLSDALFLAGGINPAYENVNMAEINRLSYDGLKMETINVDINSDIELKRGDRIRIIAFETQRKNFSVTVIGEVNIPGSIPIKKENTTLNEIIKKAGGFTKDADLDNAQILRGVNVFKSIAFSEELEQLQMLRMSTLIEEDSLYFRIDEKLRFLRGNANVDFKMLEKQDLTDTLFIARDGDIIYVPPKVNLIYVYGQVNEPAYVKYSSGMDYNYYINEAGGLGETALDVYIIKGKTRNWISAEEAEEKNIQLEPGDYIWVSKEPVRTFWYHVEQASKIATVVGALATVVLLFIQAGK